MSRVIRIPARTPARRRRDTEPPARSLVKGLATLAALGAVIYIGLTAYNGVPGRRYSYVEARVPAIGNLIRHDPVRIAGVRVGQVQTLGLDGAGHPRIKLQIEPGVHLPSDTDVRVRANGLLGARYVQLIPGTSTTMLRDGSTLTAAPDALSFGVPDALDTFDPATRASLGDMVRGLGAGLLGHGVALNEGLSLVGDATPRFTALAVAVTRRPGAAERLVPALGRLMTTLSKSRQELAAMFAPAARAVEPFADSGRAGLRASLDRAPGALAAATGGLGRGRRLLASAHALAVSAKDVLPTVPRGLTAATALLHAAPPSLDRAAALLRSASPAVPAALRLTDAARPVLAPVTKLTSQSRPMLRYIAPHACDITNFATVMRSMTGFGGVGEGPVGPSMEFRAQVIPVAEVLSAGGALDPAKKVAYAPPCTFLSKQYPYEADR